jgi:hypothetical protein
MRFFHGMSGVLNAIAGLDYVLTGQVACAVICLTLAAVLLYQQLSWHA